MAQTAQTRVIPKSQWPKALRGKPGVFVRKGMVLHRQGREIAPLWLLRRRQQVAPRLGMVETVSALLQPRFAIHLERAWRS